ncbi:MAG: PLP-dependent aminotransferase family protein [Xylophilus ampelinus]
MRSTVPPASALDRHNGESLPRQLARHIKAWIAQQRCPPGHRLASVRDLARRHGLSTQTVADAYALLIASGLVVSRRGAGYYVAEAHRAAATESAPGEQLDPRRLRGEVSAHPASVVRLGAGLPADWHDTPLLEAAWRKFARRGLARFGDYGATRGHESLRTGLSRTLHAAGIQASAADILLTTGATQAIDLVVRQLVHPGDTVLVEDPGYFQTHWAIRAQGARAVGVPRTAQGPDPDALARLCQDMKPRLFFTQSALQNPTGSALALPVAYEVLRVAERHDLLVVEDDVSGDLAPPHLPRLAMLDQLRRVLYVGSFSKTLPPGLRVGYLATRRAALLETLTQTKLVSTFVSSEMNESFVHAIMEDGVYARHVQSIRERLADRAKSATARLRAMGFEPEPDHVFQGGTFLWMQHPDHPDARRLADGAAARGIFLAPGCAFRPGQEASPHLRFALPLCTAPSLDALSDYLQDLRRP